MRKNAAPIVVTIALLSGTAAIAAAPDVDRMPLDQVVRRLGEAGYSDVRKLESENGRWEGRAVKDGNKVSFTVDPSTGAIAEKVKSAKDRKAADGDDD